MESESDPLTRRAVDLFEKEPLKGNSEVHLHTPTKFGEDRSKDLGGDREQTDRQTNRQTDKRCSIYSMISVRAHCNPLEIYIYIYIYIYKLSYLGIYIYNTIHMYSGITSGRVLNGELLYTKILEVNLFAFAYRLFRRDFSPLDGTYCMSFLSFSS